MTNFYEIGRSHALSEPPFPANPFGAGAQNPEEYNQYMSGYNSVSFFKIVPITKSLEKLLKNDKINKSNN